MKSTQGSEPFRDRATQRSNENGTPSLVVASIESMRKRARMNSESSFSSLISMFW